MFMLLLFTVLGLSLNVLPKFNTSTVALVGAIAQAKVKASITFDSKPAVNDNMSIERSPEVSQARTCCTGGGSCSLTDSSAAIGSPCSCTIGGRDYVGQICGTT
jgi:hypothetical protein